jgi:trehalose/maltose transport system permease protein
MRATSRRVGFYAVLAVLLAYIGFPLYWAIRSSLTPVEELFSTPVVYWPAHPTLDHYRSVLGNADFLQSLANSAIVAGGVTLASLVVGALGGFALGRFRFKGRTIVLYLILSMTIFPQVAVLGALFKLVTRVGLYNQLGSLVLTYFIFTLPFAVWVLTSFFRGLPRELEEAAYVDGATPMQAFRRVLLPLTLPGLVTTGLLSFIAAWNEFLFAVSFTNTPDKYTVPVSIFTFNPRTSGGFEVPWGEIMAATVVVTVPLIALTVIFQRRILAGLTAGSVKG